MLLRIITAALLRSVIGIGARGGGPLVSEAPPSSKSLHESTEGMLDELAVAARAGRAVAASFLEIFSLEVRNAGVTLMWMVTWGVFSAILLAAAWVGIMAACAIWSINLGISPLLVVPVFVFVNLVIAGAMLFHARSMSRELCFPATRRQFQLSGDSDVTHSIP